MSSPQKINAPKGTVDILPDDVWKWQAVERIARETARLFHFNEVRTPLFEHSEVFHRGVGETTDIVQKETYTFDDRGGRSLTLRPEQTAGVVRSMIENGLLNDEGARAKVFYIGPNFRYENVQRGRQRQHHQFGIEAFGVAEPEQDVECILLQLDFYRRCGVKDLSLAVNSLGDRDSKTRYRDVLVDYLRPKSSQLSEDSQRRLQTNPLRILDSKDPRDAEALRGAPPSVDFLSEYSRTHFERVTKLLRDADAPVSIDGKLVRGFDYYTGTLWQFTAGGLDKDLGGGGRYDNLVENLGGRPTPGVGFGSGLERLLIALEAQGVELPRDAAPLVWLAQRGDAARDANLQLLRELRDAGVAADMDLARRSIKAQFRLADREKATLCLVIGDAELSANTVVVKDLRSGQQATVPRAGAIDHVKHALAI
jgi:histidyl-tRNA synthetase